MTTGRINQIAGVVLAKPATLSLPHLLDRSSPGEDRARREKRRWRRVIMSDGMKTARTRRELLLFSAENLSSAFTSPSCHRQLAGGAAVVADYRLPQRLAHHRVLLCVSTNTTFRGPRGVEAREGILVFSPSRRRRATRVASPSRPPTPASPVIGAGRG